VYCDAKLDFRVHLSNEDCVAHRPLALTLGIVIICAGPADVRAIDLPLTQNDMKRAVAVARWPHSDIERSQFHNRCPRYVQKPRGAAELHVDGNYSKYNGCNG